MATTRESGAHRHRSGAVLPMILTTVLVLLLAAAVVFLGSQEPLARALAAGRAKELPAGVTITAVPTPGDPDDVANMETNPVGAAGDLEARTGEYPVKPDSLLPVAEEWVAGRIAAFSSGVPGAGAGADDAAHLELGWSPILRAGPYLGVDLTSTVTPEPGETTHQSVYADVTSGGAWSAPGDLFTGTAAERVAALVRTAANQPEFAGRPHPSAAEARALARVAMAAAQLRPEGLVLPLDGDRALLLEAEPAADYLTEAGNSILAAAVAGTGFAGIPAPPPPPGRPAGPDRLTFPVRVDCSSASCVALTFDDGPGPHTGRLLDILAEHDAPATFFLLGEQTRKRPELVRRMAEEGHVVGNHTWGHPDLATLEPREIDRQIATAADEIATAGAPRPVLLRPPYGSLSDSARDRIAAAGDATVLWDVDTLDWKTRDTKKTVAAALTDARRGSIILMHDIHEPTVDAVADIITGLREEGYTLVGVPDLFGGTMNKGGIYRDGR
ncbi:polysaccharide deacetylase family protein [Pseudactinotalea sp. HY158]|uniref:polysaccharide deacetylase family protein n=1 Tax=Pseudactinotalea sp. HY158 TaxID=2654547 RepID=UPI00129CC964|nr:polysaccharide deacetylase family protein [Pseudactinotalea sp. HY158]QGH69535.1 polysaccharide deacetylase family protein [Pseudactinotalea sp. HY158]